MLSYNIVSHSTHIITHIILISRFVYDDTSIKRFFFLLSVLLYFSASIILLVQTISSPATENL